MCLVALKPDRFIGWYMASRHLHLLEEELCLGSGHGVQAQRNQMESSSEEFVDKPFELAQDNVVSISFWSFRAPSPYINAYFIRKQARPLPSFCKTLLDGEESIDDQDMFDIKWTANSMYAGVCD